MALKKLGYADLPQHRTTGCFEHADMHGPADCLYVAHENWESPENRTRRVTSLHQLLEQSP